MGALWAPRNFDLGDHLLGLGTQAKTLGSPKGSLKFSLEHSLAIETCVDFYSADVASVNHDHLYFCIKEQATPTICCPGCSRGGGICPNFLPYPRGFSMSLSRQLWQMPLGARGSTPWDGRWYPHIGEWCLMACLLVWIFSPRKGKSWLISHQTAQPLTDIP